ncbi:DUF3108 domain-containing protein [Sulfurovum riftiae]|uniref:DUF3108 domain-containing protein n=1 Tax=Sulfurovum riftiae TaxID=1630136 RepID=A0A151CFK3_9BACT|nr:DUF3108 domain-containing protein [Sulfurovum riftiae]KYJ86301.1 hypothetical protein AS592_05760 [Sulfurovum riftiae]
MKKNIWVLFLLILLLTMSEAKTLNATYSVSYGMFGELGISEAHLETKDDTYVIEVSARTTGIVKRLSKNRREKYVSRGHIVDGMFVSDSLEVFRSYGNKVSTKHYTIDHKNKKVTKSYVKKKAGEIYGKESKILDFYSRDDLLTLYFNLPDRVDLNKAGRYELTAVGAEKQNGKVTIVIPEAKDRKRYEESLGKGDFHYLTAIVYQKLFESSRGELMIAIGKDGIAEKAVLKDLILYGDLVANRVK